MSTDSDDLDSEAYRRVEEVCDAFLKRLRTGKPIRWQQLVHEHPELAPQLEERLRILEVFYEAENFSTEGASIPEADPDKDNGPEVLFKQAFPPSLANRINCPHCGNQIQVVETLIGEITCVSCGSSVEVDPDGTRTDHRHPLPKEIGRFRVKRILGQGAFGMVYLAHDPELKRDIALKVPRQGFFLSDDEEQRFFREAQSAARLQHQNIVRVHEVSLINTTPFIVSEFIEGVTLTDLASGGQLEFREIALLMLQICSAVADAHAHGVIHRDLKPSNILVDHQRKPFVTDFGLARRDDVEVTMTIEGAILGTPAYMSPEQASGQQKEIDYQSDVYSLGVILYKLLSNELPFSGSKRMLLYQVVNDDPISPSKFNRSIPRDLESITLTAMAREKSRRYSSADLLRQELQNWLEGKPIQARPMGWIEKSTRWCRRYPTAAAFLATVATFLISATIFFWSTVRREIALRKTADDNAAEAIQNKNESNQRLHQIYQQNGFNALNENQLVKSAYWFSHALDLQEDPMTRLRCGMVIDQMPVLSGVYPVGTRIQAVRFSRSGERLAIGTLDGRLLVFDTATQEKLVDQPSDGIGIFNMEFLLDDKYVVFRDSRTGLKIWDLVDNQLKDEIFLASTISSVEVSSDGTRLVVASQESVIKVWDAVLSTTIASISFTGEAFRTSSLSHDARFLLTTSRSPDGTSVLLRLRDLQEETQIAEIPFDSTMDLDFAASGKQFLTYQVGVGIRFWSTFDGTQLGETIVPSKKIGSPRYSSDSKSVLASTGNDEIISIDVETGRESRKIQLDFDFNDIAIDRDQDRLAVSSTKGELRFYEIDRGIEVASRLDNVALHPNLTFHPNQHELGFQANDFTFQTWSFAASVLDSIEFMHAKPARAAFFIPSFRRCFTVGKDEAAIHSLDTGNKLSALRHKGMVLEGKVSANGKFVATASDDKTARVWDSQTGAAVVPFLSHDSALSEIEFSPNSKLIITGCDDGTVRAWKWGPNPNELVEPVYSLKHGDEKIRRLTFNSSGELFASAGMGGVIKVWNSETGQQVVECELLHPDRTLDCVFANADQWIITSGNDAKVFVWDVASGEKLQTLSCSGEVPDIGVFKYRDTEWLIASDISGSVQLFERQDGRFKLQREFRNVDLPSVAFSTISKDQTLAFSGGGSFLKNSPKREKGAAVLWDTTTGLPIGPSFRHDLMVRRVRFNENADSALIASEDGLVRYIKLNSVELSSTELLEIMDAYYSPTLNGLEQNAKNTGKKKIKLYLSAKSKFKNYFRVTDQELEQWSIPTDLE